MSRRGHARRLFTVRKTERRFEIYGVKNHTEATDKNQYAHLQNSQQILLGKFNWAKTVIYGSKHGIMIKSEPIWLNDEICHKEGRSEFRYYTANRFAESKISDNRFSSYPARRVSLYNKQGLCVPKSQSKAADFLATVLFGGLPPPIPRKGEMCMGKDIRIAVRVTAK